MEDSSSYSSGESGVEEDEEEENQEEEEEEEQDFQEKERNEFLSYDSKQSIARQREVLSTAVSVMGLCSRAVARSVLRLYRW
jgi:hypothetical protein